MTATEQKTREEILALVKEDDSIFIVGCGDCATLCQTGGEVEVEEMTQFLQENGKTVTGSIIPDSGCQVLDVGRLLRQNKEAVQAADALLVLSCGAGVQAAVENVKDKPVYPGCNSLFLADTTRLGNLHEWCSMCGECVIADYGGICPVTRCPKGQLNGPCGGTDQGKCEVDPEQDCVWTLIYKRFDNVPGKEKVEATFVGAKNFQKNKRPAKRIFEPRRGK
ncbi:MAG: methylenetetrahydrofolate reductase C-terminal domain-containing protein [Armatimonadetes bacterium]|nr:methylenetetrahydrofolate reductase C-terminal domain-containing protein [Armatimonadota bacterium]